MSSFWLCKGGRQQEKIRGANSYKPPAHPLSTPGPPKTLTFTVMLLLPGPEMLGKLDSSQSMNGAFAG